MTIFDSLILLLALTVLVVGLIHKFNIPAILGYLVIGIVVGPYTMRWFPDSNEIHQLAEMGVVFLLFTIGLEFSLTKLVNLKKQVFFYGGIQVCVTLLLTTIIGLYLSLSLTQSIVVASVITMSSTAIVTKLLKEQGELEHRHGLASVGILLFQDLAVIPILILIPRLAKLSGAAIGLELFVALIKGIVAIVVIILVGRRLLRPFFYAVAKTKSVELFTITVLLVTLGSAWLTHQLGLSLALGAFLSGIMLAETEFKHQVESDIRPFRDVLLGLFFISIGMQLNPYYLPKIWGWMILLLLAIVVLKACIITITCWYFGNPKDTSLRSGLILAHGGEFGFAILTLAMANQILPPLYQQALLSALFLSMMLSPLMIKHNLTLSSLLLGGTPKARKRGLNLEINEALRDVDEFVLVCGYGRVGQNIARLIDQLGWVSVALDMDINRVRNAKLAGFRVCYADATDKNVLSLVGAARAKAIVISFHDTRSAQACLSVIRDISKTVPVIVRSYDESDVDELYRLGANEVVPEVFEASLMLASHLLLSMGSPIRKVQRVVDEARGNRYDLLQQVFPGSNPHDYEEIESPKTILKAVEIQDSVLFDHSIASIVEKIKPVSILMLRRKEKRYFKGFDTEYLKKHDVLVLKGTLVDISRAVDVVIMGDS